MHPNDVTIPASEVARSAFAYVGIALSRMPLQAGNRTPGSQRATPRLRDLGLTKRRSAECQSLAKIPNDNFQDYPITPDSPEPVLATSLIHATQQTDTRGGDN